MRGGGSLIAHGAGREIRKPPWHASGAGVQRRRTAPQLVEGGGHGCVGGLRIEQQAVRDGIERHPMARVQLRESGSVAQRGDALDEQRVWRSEEHTSELQSRPHLVCRLLLEKKKTKTHLHVTVNPPND